MNRKALPFRIAQSLRAFPPLHRAMKGAYVMVDRMRLAFRSREPQLHPEVRLRALEEPSEHFFGYFDKSPWDADGRRLLYHRRTGGPEVELVVYDLEARTGTVLGASPAWNCQQGSMLQWWPGDADTVAWNTVRDGRLVTLIRSAAGSADEGRPLPMPVQTARGDGRAFISLNYRRLERTRVDYAYRCDVTNLSPGLPYEEDGLWRVEIGTGSVELVVTIRDLLGRGPAASMENAEHWVNHALYAPSGRRLAFMHRWRRTEKSDRLYTVNDDGSDLRLLLDDGMCSHYSWLDDRTLLAYCRKQPWGDGYFLLHDEDGSADPLGRGELEARGDGHPTFSPDRRWVVTDSYADLDRLRALILFEVSTGRKQVAGRFFSPWAFEGPNRCDLHPRWSPDGRSICIDSAHTGRRGVYLVDCSSVIEGSGPATGQAEADEPAQRCSQPKGECIP
jgi:hypothetical protein